MCGHICCEIHMIGNELDRFCSSFKVSCRLSVLTIRKWLLYELCFIHHYTVDNRDFSACKIVLMWLHRIKYSQCTCHPKYYEFLFLLQMSLVRQKNVEESISKYRQIYQSSVLCKCTLHTEFLSNVKTMFIAKR